MNHHNATAGRKKIQQYFIGCNPQKLNVGLGILLGDYFPSGILKREMYWGLLENAVNPALTAIIEQVGRYFNENLISNKMVFFHLR